MADNSASSSELWNLMYEQPTLTLHVLGFLPAGDLVALAATSWSSHSLAFDNSLWRAICLRRYSQASACPPPDANWRAELWRQKSRAEYMRALTYGRVGRLDRRSAPVIECYSYHGVGANVQDEADLRSAFARRCTVAVEGDASPGQAASAVENSRLSRVLARQGSICWSVLKPTLSPASMLASCGPGSVAGVGGC